MKNQRQKTGKYGTFFYVLILFLLTASCDRGNTGNIDTQIEEDNKQDKVFAVEASYSNLAEIKMGEIAKTKAVDESVVQFAEMMVTEHTKALDRLREIADERGIDIPDTLKLQHKRIQEELSDLKGVAFDSVYMYEQIKAHQQAQALFQNEIDADSHPDFQAYAKSTLEHIKSHLKRAKEIVAADSLQFNRGN